MLDHAHAYHPIKALGNFAVVAKLDFHVQSATPTLGVNQLLPRNCYSEYLATMVASGVTGQSTPAAADVQQAKTGSEMQPLANPIQLPQLRRSEVVALGEERPDIWKSKYKTVLELGTNCAATHLIQRVAVPPAIHVGLAETERPGSQYSAKEPPVMHLYVPGTSAVDANVGAREKIGHHISGSGHMIWPIAGALSSRLTKRARCGE